MKAVLRATAMLASTSAVTVLIGMLSAKAWALIVGPAGMGYLGLMQGMVALGGIVAGMGLGSALVQMGAGALGRGDVAAERAARASALRLTIALGLAAIAVFALLRAPLSRWLLGSGAHSTDAALLGIAVFASLLMNVQIAALNAHHRLRELARSAILTSVLGAACALPILWFWRERGMVWAVIAPLCVGATVASWMARRSLDATESPSPPMRRAAMRGLLAFGVPHMGGALVGSGVQFLLPVLILTRLGAEGVGFHRIASTLAVGYLGFLLTAMGQDYYPRVSATTHDPEALSAILNQQLRLVTLAGGAIMVVAQVATPYLVPILYSESFMPAVHILEWQWAANVFKLWGWVLAIVILAVRGSRAYFVTELIGGASLLVASELGMREYGLKGLGIGFLGMNVVYFVVVAGIVRHQLAIKLSGDNLVLMAAALGLVSAVALVPLLGLGAWGEGGRLAIAIAAVGIAGRLVWRDYHRSDHPVPSPVTTT